MSFTHICVLDFEATCNDGPWRKQEIIEFPSVLYDLRSGSRVAEFQFYIKPLHNPILTPFCIELTGILQSWVDGSDVPRSSSWSDDFAAVLAAHSEFLAYHCDGDPTNALILTCGDWDLKDMLVRQAQLSGLVIPPYLKRWCNIKVLFTQHYHQKSGGMTRMLDSLGITLQGRHHSGIDDCRNTTSIVERMLQDGVTFDVTSDRIPERARKT